MRKPLGFFCSISNSTQKISQLHLYSTYVVYHDGVLGRREYFREVPIAPGKQL